MAKPTGFLEHDRREPPKRPVADRIGDYREVERLMSLEELAAQAARCMDCGIPYCHAFGCPLGNLIPDWNEAVFRDQWRRALDLLHSTCNFPEFTGRICPAPCEASCTLMIEEKPVSIRHVELQIAERGWREGWIAPEPPARKTGHRVAVVGSGPAGLVAAQRLARAGHDVIVFEKADRLGGLLRYGIPDYKLEKWVIDRRLEQMRAEGVIFETGVDVGVDVTARYLTQRFRAILLAGGARVPRDLTIPGRELDGVHFAMDFLTQQNKRNAGDRVSSDDAILATGKKILVIGGGDTGSDCIGTSRRQGAKSITQVEILPKPPEKRASSNPWPTWPQTLRHSTAHEEGCERIWSVLVKEFVSAGYPADKDGLVGADALAGKEGAVGKVRCARLEWTSDALGRLSSAEVPGSDFELEADLVLLAMGFVHAEHGPFFEELALQTDAKGNLRVGADWSRRPRGVFAAGDSVRGASLVVHAMTQGRDAAQAVEGYLRAI